MANGKPGDHPLSEILLHGMPVFNPTVDELIVKLSQLVSRKELDELVDWCAPPPMTELELRLREEYELRLADAK